MAAGPTLKPTNETYWTLCDPSLLSLSLFGVLDDSGIGGWRESCASLTAISLKFDFGSFQNKINLTDLQRPRAVKQLALQQLALHFLVKTTKVNSFVHPLHFVSIDML